MACTVVAGCGHTKVTYVDGLAREQTVWYDPDCQGCLDGTWFGYCDADDCTGMCDSKGPCHCVGCASPRCCKKD
jgi:hypothetical protein